MLYRYATEEEICERFASFKVGDTVTILKNHKCNIGVLEAGSLARVVNVYISNSCDEDDIPQIPLNKINDYKAIYEKGIFVYVVVPVEYKEGDKAAPRIRCHCDILGKGELTADAVVNTYKKKKKEATRDCLKLLLHKVLRAGLIACGIYAAVIGVFWLLGAATMDEVVDWFSFWVVMAMPFVIWLLAMPIISIFLARLITGRIRPNKSLKKGEKHYV